MEIDKNNLHHANLVLGEWSHKHEFVKFLSRTLEVELVGNPDFFAFEAEVFGIDDARDFSRRASRKALGERKVFLISSLRFTSEAQNALLKTFEDPPKNTHFFVLAREKGIFLPTLLSRMRVFKETFAGKKNLSQEEEVNKFLGLNLKERLSFAKDFAIEENDLSSFLDYLLLSLRRDKADTKSIKQVYFLRNFASDRSAASRLIIEHLALVL